MPHQMEVQVDWLQFIPKLQVHETVCLILKFGHMRSKSKNLNFLYWQPNMILTHI